MPSKLLVLIIMSVVLIMKANESAGNPRLLRIAFSVIEINNVSNEPTINNITKAGPNSKLVPKPKPKSTTL